MSAEQEQEYKTPCEQLGYELGDLFEVVDGEDACFSEGSIIRLIEDDDSDCPYFKLVSGECCCWDEEAYCCLYRLKPIKKGTIISLRNTKIDLRKPDGTVDEELSRAFQDACFEQGISWCSGDKTPVYLEASDLVGFLVVDSKHLYTLHNYEEDYFKEEAATQVTFTYKRKLEWEATEVVPKDDTNKQVKTVTICGVDYKEDELSTILEALKAARV